MAPKIPEALAERSARAFFERRRQGLDSKARALILKLSKDHNVDSNVTIIYEYKDEISIFRSHTGDTGPWFPTINELVRKTPANSDLGSLIGSSLTSAKRGRSINNTEMGSVDQMTRDLLDWHARQKTALDTQPTPRNHMRTQMEQSTFVETGGHQTLQNHQPREGGDDSVNETDKDDRTDADYGSEDESGDDDYESLEKPSTVSDTKKGYPCGDLAGIPRQSPKRRRGVMEGSHADGSSFASPSPQPAYQSYSHFHGASPQLQFASSANGMNTFLPQTGVAPMPLVSHPQNGITPDNCFYPEMGMTNFDLEPNYLPERAPPIVPFRSQSRSGLPQPPLPNRSRNTKVAKKSRTSLRRNKTG
jgi:hypothetical protein